LMSVLVNAVSYRIMIHAQHEALAREGKAKSTRRPTALKGIIHAFRPEMTLYFGDSPSDERAFGVLGSGDFPVRVGPGATRAPFRVGGPDDVAMVLSAVARLRTRAASAPRR